MSMNFSDLNLKVGTRIQLQIQGTDYKPHNCETRHLGFKPGGSILVTLMEKPPQVVLSEDIDVIARLAVASGLVDFKSSIEQICETPYRYLHLSYPETINLKPLRSEARFKFDSPLTVTGITSLGMRMDDMQGRFCDLSLKGARIALPKKLADIVSSLQITTEVTIGGIEQTLTLSAEVKRSLDQDTKAGSKAFLYGISFIEISTEQQLLLMALCYELNNRATQNFF